MHLSSQTLAKIEKVEVIEKHERPKPGHIEAAMLKESVIIDTAGSKL